MIRSYWRSLALAGALLAGYFLPQAHHLSFLIRYLIIGMLYITFLRLRAPHRSARLSHVWLVLCNLAMGPLAWGAVWCLTGSRELALTAFFTGITPTAAAATVIMGFLNGRAEYVLVSFVGTTLAVAFALPFLLPPFLCGAAPGITGRIFGSMAIVVGAPLVLAVLTRIFNRRSEEWAGKLGNLSFCLWVASLFLVTANGSAFLATDSAAVGILGGSALISLLICAANFSIGYLLGGKEFRREGSQSLGQKNTALTIFLALTYGGAAAALAPTCYVLWHNLWNAIQLSKFRIKRDDPPVA